MTERDFVYWLQGYLEISNSNELSPEQIQIIKDHIKLVLDKKTPDRTSALDSRSSLLLTATC